MTPAFVDTIMELKDLFDSLGKPVAPFVAFTAIAAVGVGFVIVWFDRRDKALAAEIRAEYGPQIDELKSRIIHVEAAMNAVRPLIGDAIAEAAQIPGAGRVVEILKKALAVVAG